MTFDSAPPSSRSRNSERDTVAAPILPTSMPAATFASRATIDKARARRERDRNCRRDNVARARHVEHLERVRRHHDDGLAPLRDRHALAVERDDRRIEPEFADELVRRRADRPLVRHPDARPVAGLRAIRRQQGRSAVLRVVARRRRIDDDRDAAPAPGTDDGRRDLAGHRPLAVVLDDDRAGGLDGCGDRLQ